MYERMLQNLQRYLSSHKISRSLSTRWEHTIFRETVRACVHLEFLSRAFVIPKCMLCPKHEICFQPEVLTAATTLALLSEVKQICLFVLKFHSVSVSIKASAVCCWFWWGGNWDNGRLEVISTESKGENCGDCQLDVGWSWWTQAGVNTVCNNYDNACMLWLEALPTKVLWCKLHDCHITLRLALTTLYLLKKNTGHYIVFISYAYNNSLLPWLF